MDTRKNLLLIPPRLHSGDTIGIAAPASPFDRNRFDQGVGVLESMGFRTFVPDDLFKKNGYLAGTDSHRADLVNRLFADSSIQAIACARGGFGSLRMLSLLDFQTIIEKPKIFIGFSDISAVLSALYTRCGLVTFHGPTVASLGDVTPETQEAMRLAITSELPPEIWLQNGITLRPGLASAPVLCGNLTTLCHLLGTPFEPSLKGHILVLEDRGEMGYRIDRMLTQMKIAGCFDGIAGLALGSFEACGPINEIFEIVDNIFDGYSIPILAGLDVGHGRSNLTIPLGIDATLDAVNHSLTFHESPTAG
ncbi:MAG TPA: LD-carboxypeptidase [Desulfobacterales bacterium]|mgnify:CR=1 FL=1|nr:LD-carboxypeptidase [Desulfobacterales bacterium]